MKTVVIPSAGLGTRLDEFTKNYNKAMCTLGPKPVISYIIEKFTKEDEIIILLGYKGDLLRQVISTCYPNWNIKFIEVDNFQGPGSGLGYSLSCAKHLLQKPFIFWSNDSIIDDDISKLDYEHNFIILAEFREQKADSYRHARIGKYQVQNILPKGEYNKENTLPYIGISYIKDYQAFWHVQENMYDLFVQAGESAGLNNLSDIRYYITKSWIDTGNKEELIAAKKKFSNDMEMTILEKPDEAIWFFDNRVIKFHIDPTFIEGRVKRFNTLVNDSMRLNGIRMPALLSYTKNTYTYEKASGKIMSKEVTPESFLSMISAFLKNIKIKDVNDNYKINIYKDFYKEKTLSRIEKYCKVMEELDNPCVINGLYCQPVKNIILNIDWKNISKNAIISDNYHGDFHLENILINKDKEKPEYILLDWRQNFGKTEDGDIYYDLAKMLHSLIVNHEIVKNNNFNVIQKSNGEYRIDIYRTFIDTECEEQFKMFLTNNGYDYNFVQFLTAIIFLNIAICHIGNYAVFLFYLGKYLLNKFISVNKEYLILL